MWVKLSEDQMDSSLDGGIRTYQTSKVSTLGVVSLCNLGLSIILTIFLVYPSMPSASLPTLLLAGTGVFLIIEVAFAVAFFLEYSKFNRMSLFQRRRFIYEQRKQRSGMLCPNCGTHHAATMQVCPTCGGGLELAMNYRWIDSES